MKMTGKFALAFLVMMAAIPTSSHSQSTNILGQQSNGYANWVEARITSPKVGGCSRNYSNCFRVMVELTPQISNEVGVSRPQVWPTAFTGGGAVCTANLISGLNSSLAWAKGDRSWDLDETTFADTNKPAIAVYDFRCDSPIIAGDEVTIQMSFGYYVGPRNFGEARYLFRKIRLN